MITIDASLENADVVARAFREARPALIGRWYATTRRHAFRAVRIVQQKYRGAAQTSATATRQGTGNLRASYAQQTERLSHGVQATLGLMRAHAKGQALRYGAVHEEGATIRGASKMLAIPLPSIRSPSGIAPRPSDFPRNETFVSKGRGFGGVICRRLPDGTIQPLFALRRQVVVPARPRGGAIAAAMTEVQPDLQRDLEQDAVAVLGGETRGTA